MNTVGEDLRLWDRVLEEVPIEYTKMTKKSLLDLSTIYIVSLFKNKLTVVF